MLAVLARNWFYKIASVKELLPRFFVEVAIVKCYMFLEPEKRFPKILQRLANICRGIGDPLVACYARSYLVRKGRELLRPEKAYIGTCVEDILFTFNNQVKTDIFKEAVVRKGCSMPEYYNLYSPALDFLFHCFGYQASRETYDGLWLLFYGSFQRDTCLLFAWPKPPCSVPCADFLLVPMLSTD